VLRKLVTRAERLAHLPPGTITAAAYARSAVLDFMGRELARMDIEPKEEAPKGPSVWERVRRAHEYFPDPEPASKDRGRRSKKDDEP
jgi:hypothetical protein